MRPTNDGGRLDPNSGSDTNRSKSPIFTDFYEFHDFESNYFSKNVILVEIKDVELKFDFHFNLQFSDQDRIDRIYRILPIFFDFLD